MCIRDSTRPGFLQTLCRELGNGSEAPAVEVVQAVEGFVQEMESSDQTDKLTLDIFAFLIIGYWLCDESERADEWINRLRFDEAWLNSQLNNPANRANWLISESEANRNSSNGVSPFADRYQQITRLFLQITTNKILQFNFASRLGSSFGRTGRDPMLGEWLEANPELRAVFNLAQANALLDRFEAENR